MSDQVTDIGEGPSVGVSGIVGVRARVAMVMLVFMTMAVIGSL